MPLGLKATNNARTTLATAIGAGATTFGVTGGTGNLFPSLGAGEYCYVTLQDGTTSEVVKVVARSVDTFTCDPTVNAYPSGATVELRATAEMFNDIIANMLTPAAGATAGNFAALDASGAVVDSGEAPSDVAHLTGTESFIGHKTFKEVSETVHTIVGDAIDPANGTIQTKALAADWTVTEGLTDGQSVTLMLTSSTYTVTWPAGMKWVGGSAPTLDTTLENVIVLWKVGGQLYGSYSGAV